MCYIFLPKNTCIQALCLYELVLTRFEFKVKPDTVIYLQFYIYASQDSLGLYKVSPTKKSLRPSQNFPL